MAVAINVSSGMGKKDSDVMIDVIDASLKKESIVTISDITIPYDSETKTYTFTHESLTINSFPKVFFRDLVAADTAGLNVTLTEIGLDFTFQEEPSTEIICTIVIVNE